MPTYNFLDTVNDVEFPEFMSISEKEKFLKDNPHIRQTLASPAIVSGRGMQKPDDSFRDILRKVKSDYSRGWSKSTVNTF